MMKWLNKKPVFLFPRGYPEAASACIPFPRYWFILFIGVIAIDWPIPEGIGYTTLTLGIYFIVGVIFVGLLMIEFVRFLKLYLLIKREGRVRCTRCVYDMSGSLKAEQCPECGKAWDRAEAERQWGVFLGKKKSPPSGTV